MDLDCLKLDCTRICDIIDLLSIVQYELRNVNCKFPPHVRRDHPSDENCKDQPDLFIDNTCVLSPQGREALSVFYDLIQSTRSFILTDSEGCIIEDKHIDYCNDVRGYGVKTNIECQTVIIDLKESAVVIDDCEVLPINRLLSPCFVLDSIKVSLFFSAVCCLKEFYKKIQGICQELCKFKICKQDCVESCCVKPKLLCERPVACEVKKCSSSCPCDKKAIELEQCTDEFLWNLVYLLKLLRINITLDRDQKLGCPSDATRQNTCLIWNIIGSSRCIKTENCDGLPVTFATKCCKGQVNCKKIVAYDFQGQHSLFELTRPNGEYIPDGLGNKTYLTGVIELERFFSSCLDRSDHSVKGRNLALNNSICTLLMLISILLYQICQETEKGKVGTLVQATSRKLFNYLVINPDLTVYDSCGCEVVGKYCGKCGHDAFFYGVQLSDLDGHLVKVGMRFVKALDNLCPISIDNLTVNCSEYFNGNIKDACKYITYSNALCELKEYYSNLSRTLNEIL